MYVDLFKVELYDAWVDLNLFDCETAEEKFHVISQNFIRHMCIICQQNVPLVIMAYKLEEMNEPRALGSSFLKVNKSGNFCSA